MKKWEDYDKITCLDGEVIDMQKLLDEQETAKAAISHLEPFFAAMIGKVRFVYTFHVDTQATDGYNIFVNPQFTSHLTLEEKVFVLAHEMLHCILDHMRREKMRGDDHHKANVAADYEVNSTVVQMDIVGAKTIKQLGGLYDSKYDNWSYEKIYDSNPPDPTKPQQQQKGGQQNKGGQSGSGGQGSSGGGGSNEKKSADWKAGYEKAMADWKAGKLKV